MHEKYKTYRDSSGEWRWTYYASNGEPLAVSSEGYRNFSDCLHSIDLMKGSRDAPVVNRGTANVPALSRENVRRMAQALATPNTGRARTSLLGRIALDGDDAA
jgi:uncharacterized protein